MRDDAAALVLGYAASARFVGRSLTLQVGQRGWHLATYLAASLALLALVGAVPVL